MIYLKKIKNRLKNSLNLKIIFIIVIVVSVVLLFFEAYEAIQDYYHLKIEFDSSLNIISNRLASSLWILVYGDNEEQIDRLLINEMLNKDIYAIVVKDLIDNFIISGKIRNKDWDLIDYKGERILDKYFSKSVIIKRIDEEIGIVSVYLTDKFVRKSFFKILLGRVIAIILLLGIMIITLTILISKVVLNPIKKLKNSLEIISKGNLDVKVNVESSDEIGNLASVFNEMSKKLKTTVNDLKESEEKYKLLIEKTPSVSWASNQNGETMYISPNIKKIYGYTQDEIYKNGDKLWLKRIHPDDINYVIKSFNDFLNKKSKKYDVQYRIKRKDNKWIWLRDIADYFTELDNNEKIAYGVFTDITEQKKAEEVINKLNKSLEKKVKERTIELNETITDLKSFSYSVSHDLRAPIRHINGYLELFYDEMKDHFYGDSIKYYNKIKNSSKKMGNLIDDLLCFFKLSRNEMNLIKVDLNKIIQEIKDYMDDELKNRYIEWEIDKLPIVKGDLSMLRQVITNLISNAVKYTRDIENAVIKIGCYSKINEEIIFIQDNGVGFNKKYTKKVFDVFQRLHSDNEFEGTGIGLAIVKRIIQRHGGKVWANGVENKGATFYFSIPKSKVL